MSNELPDHTTSVDEPSVVSPIDKNRKRKFGTFAYKPEYCDIAYKLLSAGSQCKTKSHICASLQCSKPTLLNWMANFPEFKKAIESGLEVGAVKWRNKIRKHAFSPSSEVNNGLIKLLSSNVYGIKEDVTPAVIVNNTNNFDPEVELKKRGIPIPSVDSKDIDN